MNAGEKSSHVGQQAWVRRLLVGRNPRLTLVRCVALVAISVVVFKFMLLPIRVQGESMLPTYQDRSINFVNRLAYLGHPPRRGDVVAIRLTGEHVLYMKRILALPGETLAFHQGHVFINGQQLEEPYVKLPCNWEIGPQQIGPDEYYVVGDNRSMYKDDHVKGKAERQRIVGKVLL